jgi:SAM-dependent methyltransferase
VSSIFVSSTYKDLRDYRDRVERVVLKYGNLVRGMEFFGDPSRPTLEACYAEIDQYELVICIIGISYGTRPTPEQPSFTALEIEYAQKKKIPIAPFFLDIEKPVIFPPKYCAQGKDYEDLNLFKQRLGLPSRTPAYFVSPEDLGEQVSTYLGSQYKNISEAYRKEEQAKKAYRESNYDLIAEWYDQWYAEHWKSADAFKAIEALGKQHYKDVFHDAKEQIRVLDCACGTGNSFVAFQEAGYKCFGTDGSQAMLNKAVKNCNDNQIDHSNIIERPINWKDLDSYEQYLPTRTGSNPQFDVIINTNNSFCHIPPIREYLGLALQNFRSLLRPEGLLIIDTKRYIRDTPLRDTDGKFEKAPVYKEQKFEDGQWCLRTEREETRGPTSFHTRLHYDTDKSFGPEVQRALIALTIHGGPTHPRTFVIPYYPLPAHILASFMWDAGFTPKIFPASEKPDAKYRYDIVVGRKNDLRHEHQ